MRFSGVISYRDTPSRNNVVKENIETIYFNYEMNLEGSKNINIYISKKVIFG